MLSSRPLNQKEFRDMVEEAETMGYWQQKELADRYPSIGRVLRVGMEPEIIGVFAKMTVSLLGFGIVADFATDVFPELGYFEVEDMIRSVWNTFKTGVTLLGQYILCLIPAAFVVKVGDIVIKSSANIRNARVTKE